jgi:undecaprenyl-diphosphatase
VDTAVTAWINGLSGVGPIDSVMAAIAAYGVPLMVALVAVQWFARADRSHFRHICLFAGLAFLLGLAINQGVLLEVHRLRPYDAGVTRLLIAKSADWSFPSDHATAALAIVFAFWTKGLKRRAFGYAVLAGLICFSRVYLGIHYAGDILGGAVTAALAVGLVNWAYREGNGIEQKLVKIL